MIVERVAATPHLCVGPALARGPPRATRSHRVSSACSTALTGGSSCLLQLDGLLTAVLFLLVMRGVPGAAPGGFHRRASLVLALLLLVTVGFIGQA